MCLIAPFLFSYLIFLAPAPVALGSNVDIGKWILSDEGQSAGVMTLLFLPHCLPHSPPHTHSLLLTLSGRGLEHRVPSAHFSHSPLRVSTSAPTTHTRTHKPLTFSHHWALMVISVCFVCITTCGLHHFQSSCVCVCVCQNANLPLPVSSLLSSSGVCVSVCAVSCSGKDDGV